MRCPVIGKNASAGSYSRVPFFRFSQYSREKKSNLLNWVEARSQRHLVALFYTLQQLSRTHSHTLAVWFVFTISLNSFSFFSLSIFEKNPHDPSKVNSHGLRRHGHVHLFCSLTCSAPGHKSGSLSASERTTDSYVPSPFMNGIG